METRWRTTLPAARTPAIRPAIVGGTVLAMSRGRSDVHATLHGRELADGGVLWSTASEAPGNAELVGGDDANVVWWRNGLGVAAHAVDTGAERWRRGDAFSLGGVWAGTLIVVGLGHWREPQARLGCLAIETGETMWEETYQKLTLTPYLAVAGVIPSTAAG